MADTTLGTATGTRPALFLRNATGLVKAWSTFDAFVYSFWSVNLITLGLYGMSYVYWVPDGQLLAAIVVFGVLTTFLVVTYAMFVSVVVTLGMETYARIQKSCFWIGIVGLVVVCGLLLFASQSDFQAAFNREATSLFGAPANAYQATIDAGTKAGYAPHDFGFFSLGPIFLVLPFLAFYLLLPNWGATLYGEVRGAKDIRKPFWSMFLGLWVTGGMVALVVILIVKTMGWQFYNAANAAW